MINPTSSLQKQDLKNIEFLLQNIAGNLSKIYKLLKEIKSRPTIVNIAKLSGDAIDQVAEQIFETIKKQRKRQGV